MSLIVFLIALVAPGQGAKQAKPIAGAPDVRCGSFCLQVALETFHLAPASFAELEKSLGPPGSGGYSMDRLDVEARKRGASTIAVETTLENLAARREKFACITLLGPNHFALLYDTDAQSAYIVDPPRSYTMPIDTFRQVWTRQALLIGPTPFAPEETIRPGPSRARSFLWLFLASALVIAAGLALRARRRGREPSRSPGLMAGLLLLVLLGPSAGCRPGGVAPVAAKDGPAKPTPSGPRLVIEPGEHALGEVAIPTPGAIREVRTRLKNAGDSPLVISSIGTSCSCTVGSLGHDHLAPGESTELTTQIRLGDSAEARQTALIIRTSDLAHPAATIRFTWTAIHPLRTSPVEVVLLGLKPGEERSARVAIAARGLALCPRCRVEATAPSSIRCAIRPPEVAPDSGHDAPVAAADRPAGSLDVHLSGGLEPLATRQTIGLVLRCDDEERARLDVPISWSVVPAIEVSPSRLSLGLRGPGERASAKVVLRAGDAVPFRITRITCDDGDAFKGSGDPSGSSASHVVDLDFAAPRDPGPWRSTLRLETDRPGAEHLILPVSAVVVAEGRGTAPAIGKDGDR